MKKTILTLITLFTIVINSSAMPYAEARNQALFLTDKMAYELNLSPEQMEMVYEVNLDYFMNVSSVNDVYATGWRQRNYDLQYILSDIQYRTFCAASYFFRPLFWSAGRWHFGIYTHYPQRTHFYYSHPANYAAYRGGHSWRHNGGRSWYVHHVNRAPVHEHKQAPVKHDYRPAAPAPGRQDYRSSAPASGRQNYQPNRSEGVQRNGAQRNGVQNNGTQNYRSETSPRTGTRTGAATRSSTRETVETRRGGRR